MHNKNFDFWSSNNRNKNKKHNPYIIFSIVITVFAIIISFGSLIVKNNLKALETSAETNQNSSNYYTPKEESSQEADKETTNMHSLEEKKDVYTITIYKEKISVFKNNETSPLIVSDASLNLLTAEDIRLLEKGIKTSDYNEVRYFLEDFE